MRKCTRLAAGLASVAGAAPSVEGDVSSTGARKDNLPATIRAGKPRRATEPHDTVHGVDAHPDDLNWYFGPPYAVAESVFDKHDLEASEPIRTDA